MIGGEAEWWYEADGETRGPIHASEIRSMIEAGALGFGSLVIPRGGNRWGIVGEYAEQLGLGKSERGTSGVHPPRPPSAPTTWSGSDGIGPSPDQPASPLASLLPRFGAYYLDLILLPMTWFVGWIIWSILVWPRGLSPGKQILRLRVLNVRTRQPPSRALMATRELVAKFLLEVVTLGIVTIVSGFMLLFSDSRQAVWDKIAGTVVVDEGAGRPARTGWALLGLALLSFILAFGASDPEGNTEGGVVIFVAIMVTISAGLAITGLALVLTSLFRRGRGRS